MTICDLCGVPICEESSRIVFQERPEQKFPSSIEVCEICYEYEKERLFNKKRDVGEKHREDIT